MQSQPNYWWEFKKHSNAEALLMGAVFAGLVVLIMAVAIGAADASEAPGYVGYGCCCSIVPLILASLFVRPVLARRKRDQLAAQMSRSLPEPDDD